jgi:hypothetical protein
MALAETAEQRAAIALVFTEMKAEEVRLEQRLGEVKPVVPIADPEREVAAAMSAFHRLSELADLPDTNYATVSEVFRQTNVKLFLRFREIDVGKRRINIPSGGVLTFGSTAPPVALYDGPTDGAIIRKMLDEGQSVSSVPRQGASG